MKFINSRNFAIVSGMLVMLFATSLAAGTDRARTIGSYTERSMFYANLSVPKQPLRLSDVERWAQLLQVSEPQREFMLLEYRSFVDRHNAYLDREAPALVALSRQLAETIRERGLSSPDAMELSNRLDALAKRIRDSLIAIELGFLRAIEPNLTPEQLGRLHIVRNEAKRRNNRTYHSFARWDGIELREVWNRSIATLAAPDEGELVEGHLAEHEEQLTGLVCRRSDMEFEHRRQQWENRIGRATGEIASRDASDQYNRLMSARLRIAQRVRSLNERTVDGISDAVSDSLAQVFVDAVKRTVFPELYPDESALHDLLDAVVADEQLDSELHSEAVQYVNSLRREYHARHIQLCKALEAICLEWADGAEGGNTWQYEPQELPAALQPLFEERAELSRQYLKKLTELLGSEVLDRHVALIPAAMREFKANWSAE